MKHNYFLKFFILFLLGLSYSPGWAQTPIFSPGMTITPLGSVSSPGGEDVTKIIDQNVNTKFLDFNVGDGMGFTVYMGGNYYVATTLEMSTANDVAGRDPQSFEVSGSNDGTNFTSVTSGSIPCVSTRFFTRSFSFTNTTAFKYYRINYTNSCGVNIFQVAETQLYGTLVPNTPPAAACKAFTAQLDSSGNVTISPSDVDGGSTDAEGFVTLSLNKGTFDCTNIGANEVELTVTDSDGATATCLATVTVEDNEAPTAIAQDIIGELDANGEVTITASQINNGSTDNCAISSLTFKGEMAFGEVMEGQNLTITLPAGRVVTSVTFASYGTPTGSNGNYIQGSCHAANSKSIVEGYALGQNSFTIPANNGLFGDPCSGTVKRLYVAVNSFIEAPERTFTCNEIGVNAVNLVVTDVNGNISTATATVTVEDNVAPEITCPANIAQDNDPQTCGAIVTYLTPVGTDNCTGVITEQIAGLASGEVFPVGTTTNTFKVTDASDNTTQCSFDVVISDVEAPLITCPNSIVTDTDPGSCTARVTFSNPPIVVDNCVVETTQTAGLPSGSSFPVGDNFVEFSTTDGTFTRTCSFTITVEDNVMPDAIAQNLTVALDADGNASITAAEIDNGSTDNCGIKSMFVSPKSFTCANVGTNTVTLTVIDNNDNESTTTATVTVEDNIAPVINCIADATRDTDSGVCEYTVQGTELDATFTDNCGGIITNDLNGTATIAGAILPKGDTSVIWTVNDGNGQMATCTTIITVEDNEVPTAIAQDITVQLDADGIATITPAQINNGSTDNCTADGDLVLSLDKTEFSCADVGGVNSALDLDGGDDYISITNPYSQFSNEITVSWWVNFKGDSAWMTQSTENVDNMNTNVWLFHASGANGINWYVNDGGSWKNIAGNTTAGWHMVTGTANALATRLYIDGVLVNSTSGISSGIRNNTNSVIQIGKDGRFPINSNRSSRFDVDEVLVFDRSLTQVEIETLKTNAPELNNVNLKGYWDMNENTGSTINDKSVTGANGILENMDPLTDWIQSGSSLPNGNVVALTVTDASGNESTATAIVTVEDNVAAEAIAKDITVQLDETGNVEITAEDVDNGSNDACGIESMSVSLDSFTCSEVGDNTVTLTVIDNNGNESTTTSTVSVEDNIAAIAMAKDITVQLDETGNVSINAADVDNGSNDACGIKSMSVSTGSFTCSEVGANTVTLIVIDNNGNESTTTSTVSVEDNIAAIAMAKDITVQLDETGNVSITAADVDNGSNDACGIKSMSVSPNEFTCSEVGDNTVTLTVIDNNGNESTTTSTVSVEDNVAAIALAKDITVQLDETGNVSITAADVDNGSNDACGIQSMSVSPSAFTCSEVGDNTVTLTVIDNNDNESTATSTVTVEDNVAAIAMAKDITVQLDETGNVEITAADVDNESNDACGIKSMSVSPAAFTCAEVGDNTVTLTVIDNNGNESTTTSTVSVEDNVAAIAMAKDITVQLDETGNVSITAADVDNGSNDACGIKSMSVSPAAFTCAEVGANTVTLTVIDNNGNESTTTSTVTVEDNLAAIAMAKDIAVQLDATGNVSITAADVDNGSNDACGIASLSVLPNAFTCAEVGANTVTLTVIDNNGNESTTTSTVTVEDNVAAIALAKDITVLLDETGNVSITAADVDNGSNDACGIASMSVSPDSFTCSEVGENTVTLTVIDNNGNGSTATAIVTVEDSIKPIPSATVLPEITAVCEVLEADVTVPTATDNCGGVVSVSNDVSFPITTQGLTVITWSFEDANGNSTTQTQDVMIADTSAPVPDLSELESIVVECEASSIVAPTATDNCGGSITGTTLDPMSYSEEGDFMILWEFNDGNGNVATQEQWVTVKDNTAPQINTRDLTITVDQDEPAIITREQVNDDSSDNCSEITFTLDKDTFGKPGVYEVVLTGTDASGNTSQSTATIKVKRVGADPMEVHVVPTMLTGTSIAKVILPFRGRIMEVQVIEVETNNYKMFDGNKKNVMEIDVAPMKGTLLVKILDNEGNFHLTKLIAL